MSAQQRADAALRQKQFRRMASEYTAAAPLIDDGQLKAYLVKRGASEAEALDAVLNMSHVR